MEGRSRQVIVVTAPIPNPSIRRMWTEAISFRFAPWPYSGGAADNFAERMALPIIENRCPVDKETKWEAVKS